MHQGVRYRSKRGCRAKLAISDVQAHDNGDDQLPWGTLRYLIGEAMYGGRVSDSYDRRILITYLDEYLGDFLFDTFQPFFFYRNDSVEYKYVCSDVPSNSSMCQWS